MADLSEISEDAVEGLTNCGYEVDSLLGTGEYGEVVRVIKDQQVYAAKVILYGNEPTEINVLFRLIHPNILHGSAFVNRLKCQTPLTAIITPLFGPSLSDAFKSKDYIAVKHMFQILDGLAFLHSQGIIHDDLNADNVLLDSNDNAIIIDFGICQYVDDVVIGKPLPSGDVVSQTSDMTAFATMFKGRLPQGIDLTSAVTALNSFQGQRAIGMVETAFDVGSPSSDTIHLIDIIVSILSESTADLFLSVLFLAVDLAYRSKLSNNKDAALACCVLAIRLMQPEVEKKTALLTESKSLARSVEEIILSIINQLGGCLVRPYLYSAATDIKQLTNSYHYLLLKPELYFNVDVTKWYTEKNPPTGGQSKINSRLKGFFA